MPILIWNLLCLHFQFNECNPQDNIKRGRNWRVEHEFCFVNEIELFQHIEYLVSYLQYRSTEVTRMYNLSNKNNGPPEMASKLKPWQTLVYHKPWQTLHGLELRKWETRFRVAKTKHLLPANSITICMIDDYIMEINRKICILTYEGDFLILFQQSTIQTRLSHVLCRQIQKNRD